MSTTTGKNILNPCRHPSFVSGRTENAQTGYVYWSTWGTVWGVATRPATDFDRAVSAYVRTTAVLQKLTAAVVAERAGIPVDKFRRYWRGERSIGLSELRAILGVLGVDWVDATRDIERVFQSGEYGE